MLVTYLVGDAAGIRIVRGAGRDGHRTGLGRRNFGLCGGGGDVGGGDCTGEGEDYDECVNEGFHFILLQISQMLVG